jgi:hypothetical protein
VNEGVEILAADEVGLGIVGDGRDVGASEEEERKGEELRKGPK